MKRFCLICICMCMVLSGCSRDKVSDSFRDYSENMRAADCIRIKAKIRAEYEDRRSDFVLDCSVRGSEYEIRVVEPDYICGVTALLHGRDAELQYNSVIIAAPLLDKNGLSPVTALPTLTDALRCGFPTSCCVENALYFWQIIVDDDTTASVWFDPVESRPVKAELSSCGKTVIYIEITDWNGELNERFTEEDLG